MDLKNIDNETLWKIFDTAAIKYYQAATKMCENGRNFSNTKESKELDQITKQYENIGNEVRRRLGIA